MAHKWKSSNSFQKAREWVNEKYGSEVRGKSMTQAKQKKILSRYWRMAKKKDKLGQFGR